MDYKIIFSPQSLEDIADLLSPIWDDNPAAASEFGDSLLAHIELLARFPRMGRVVVGRANVRRLAHSPAIVYYRILEERKVVDIAFIRHGARKEPFFE